LLQTGMPFPQLDRLMARFGMPMGPFRLLDEIGLDVVAEVGRTMTAAFGERFAAAPVMDAVFATGLTGRKGGRGFYTYDDSKPKRPNDEIVQRIRSAVTDEPPTPPEAEERLVFSMINEAARALADDVVDAPASLDVAMIMGAGFPPFRGGLLRYADSNGLDHIAERLRHYAGSVGPRFQPAEALLQRQSFYGG
ncbi:MAG: hypothetical protein GWN71_09085, partial [Gammaproteobacteria bacterium]|nr:hypothetical protein [Gammaproteobacteria bacterium]